LGTFFELVGGGPAVATTMLHVIAADVVSEDDRSNTFVRFRATAIAASITAQVTSSLLMGFNVWLPWCLGILTLLAAAATASIIPNMPKEQTDSEIPRLAIRSGISHHAANAIGFVLPKVERNNTVRVRIEVAVKNLIAGVYIVLGNKQLMLLLWAAYLAQLGEDSLAMILLLYISKRFAWSFAKVDNPLL